VKDIKKLVISIIGCELIGILATPFTISAIPTWYLYLNKPGFSPPNWVFGPVWSFLYLLMGVSLFLIWNKKVKFTHLKLPLSLFISQLLFNFLWSFLFFELHSPLLGLIDIIVLWILIISTIVMFHKISKQAAYLLVPYLLWVSFAAILNISILFLNP